MPDQLEHDACIEQPSLTQNDFFGLKQGGIYVISFPTNWGIENFPKVYEVHKWIRVDSPNGIDLYILNSISHGAWVEMLYDSYDLEWFFGYSKTHDQTAIESKLKKVVELSARMRVLQVWPMWKRLLVYSLESGMKYESKLPPPNDLEEVLWEDMKDLLEMKMGYEANRLQSELDSFSTQFKAMQAKLDSLHVSMKSLRESNERLLNKD